MEDGMKESEWDESGMRSGMGWWGRMADKRQ